MKPADQIGIGKKKVKLMRKVLLMGFCLVVLGCATVSNKVMQSWVGDTAEHLVLSWGRPADIVKDGNYDVYIYLKGNSYTAPGYYSQNTTSNANTIGYNNVAYGRSQSQSEGYYVPPQTYNNATKCMFWVDNLGVIVGWEKKR